MLHGDSSACLIKNGKIVAAVEEERFTRIKHCSEFPINSILYCLNSNDIKIGEVSYITINTNFKYNLLNRIIFLFKNIFKINFISNRAETVVGKVKIKKKLEETFKEKIKAKIKFVPHHLSHAYSTMFFLNENKNSLIFSFDGSGDFSTIETYLVKNNEISLLQKNIFPHSLGLFYSAFTQFLGFNKFGDEFKFMGLAGYGSPIYVNEFNFLIKKKMPFKLDMKYFNLPKISYSNRFPQSNKLFNDNFENYFKLKFKTLPTNYESKLSKNIAASVQKIFEDVVFDYINYLHAKFKSDKLYLTGGCAFNSSLVGKIIESKKFNSVFVDTNPGDAGGSSGSAFYILNKLGQKIDSYQQTKFLGPSFSNDDIEKKIIKSIKNNENYTVKFYENFQNLISKATEIIIEKNIIFWFQDAMEWGPRALGNRSILANPKAKNIKNFINKKIKKRESFRPFAPAIIEEYSNDYFEMMGHKSPNMNIVFKVKKKTNLELPEIIHADNSCRVQTVSKKDNEKFYRLLNECKKKNNHPILINTSMNVDSPIVCNPQEAFDTFNKTDVNDLFLNNWLISKKKN